MRHLPTLLLLLATCLPARAEIRRHPTGVNVNAQGGTSVFITFGGLAEQVPIEASWCGALIPATPDLGMKCDPATLFGRLPIRFDQSTLAGSTFTDVMSIPASVSRRAYQAAIRGEDSRFFYVRRFRSLVGGPDEYVSVTCRMAGGGARVPLALLDVRIAFAIDAPVVSVLRGEAPPTLAAEIAYNGTGRLKGRWEVVRPGDDTPTSRDLLTEATLPPEERPLQRRFTLIDRFNVFLPPTGRVTLPGPDPSLLPTEVDGLYQILLRVEATDDKEGTSDRGAAGAGAGRVVAGGVAGFPLPTLRYFVGSAEGAPAAFAQGELGLLLPAQGAAGWGAEPLIFEWSPTRAAQLYQLELRLPDGSELPGAVVQQGIARYRAPSFLSASAPEGLEWRVVALGPEGEEIAATAWRALGAP